MLAAMCRLIRLSLALGALLPLVATIPALADPPRRVVSLNLCADQLLLALADREQIASLSYLARDRTYSFLVDAAAGLPVNKGSGESILSEGADLVLVGPYDGKARRELLAARGVPVMVLDPWRDLAHGREQVRLVANRLGHPGRGEALVAAIDAALANASNAAPVARTVLVLQRQGWVPGRDSLVNEMLRQMGLRPMNERLGVDQGGLVRLERIVTDPPDYAVMAERDGRAIDNGAAFLVHPALAVAIPPERRLALDPRLTICGGPSTPAAIDALAAQVRALVR